MPSRSAANGTNSHHHHSQGPYSVTSDMYHQVTYEPGSHDNAAYEFDDRLDFYPIDNGDPHQTRQQQITPSVITKQPARNRRLFFIILAIIIIIVVVVAVVLIVHFTTKKESTGGGVPTTTTPRTTRPADVKGSFRLKSATYVAAMADVNSDAFKGIATKYQPLIDRIYKASKLASKVKYSVITQLRQGSVIVAFDIYLEDGFTGITIVLLKEAFRKGWSNLLEKEPELEVVLLDIFLDSLHFEIVTIVTTTTKPSSGTTSGGQEPGQFPNLAEPCGVAGRAPRRRIVGGSVVESGRFPWMVAVRFGNNFHCGGSIIDSRHVLSAAHCFGGSGFPGFANGLNVMAGEVTLSKASTSSTSQIVNVSRLYGHKDFNKKRVGTTDSTIDSNLNDIAVLRLERPLTFNDYVSPVCLPQPNATLPSRCALAGWGALSEESKQVAPVMQAVNLWAYSRARCREVFSRSFYRLSVSENITDYLSDGIVCAANQTFGGQDACFGDSGGPLFCQTLESGGTAVNPRYAQFGIVSWGLGCGEPGSPGFYANVAYFRPWLHRVAFPILDYQSKILQDNVCLDVLKCGAHLKNASYTPDPLTNCQRFVNAVNCSLENPTTVLNECTVEDAEREVRQYAVALNMEFERTLLDVTNCQFPQSFS